MAPTCPRPLLVLLSLVSSSSNFLMTPSSSQQRPTLPNTSHSGQPASHPWPVHAGLLKQQNQEGVRNSSDDQFSMELGTAGPLFRQDIDQKNWKSLDRFRTTFHDSPDNSVDSQDAFRFIMNKSDHHFSKERERDAWGHNVFQRFLWKHVFSRNSQNSFNWREFRDTILRLRRQRDVSYSVDAHSDLHKRPTSSLKWLLKPMDKCVVFNKELDDKIFRKSKHCVSVMDFKGEFPKLSADNDRFGLNTDNSHVNRKSSLSFEHNIVNKHHLNNPETDHSGNFLGESSRSLTVREWLWPKPLHAAQPLHQHEHVGRMDRHSFTGRVPVAKRFKVPLHKKVFVYGRDDRLRVFLPQMRKFPFSNIARLSTGCTGTLVTPRHVLTAAHCVHNGLGFRDNLEKLKIGIPDTMGFKDYYAHKITVPTGWLRENRSGRGRQSGKRAVYDYAVVRLKLAVTGRSKFLPLAVPRPEVLQMDFHFLAFPQDDQQLWRSSCLASQHMALGDGNLIMTRCDAAVGNSGAAVFIEDPQGGLRVVGILSNTMHVGHHRSFLRYSIITALTWPKLTHICNQLGPLGRKYNVCPPVRFMRRTPYLPNIKVVPFFGKRSQAPLRSMPHTLVL